MTALRESTVLVWGSLFLSMLLFVLGFYDALHQLHGWGIVELWMSGALFVNGCYCATKRSRRAS